MNLIFQTRCLTLYLASGLYSWFEEHQLRTLHWIPAYSHCMSTSINRIIGRINLYCKSFISLLGRLLWYSCAQAIARVQNILVWSRYHSHVTTKVTCLSQACINVGQANCNDDLRIPIIKSMLYYWSNLCKRTIKWIDKHK